MVTVTAQPKPRRSFPRAGARNYFPSPCAQLGAAVSPCEIAYLHSPDAPEISQHTERRKKTTEESWYLSCVGRRCGGLFSAEGDHCGLWAGLGVSPLALPPLGLAAALKVRTGPWPGAPVRRGTAQRRNPTVPAEPGVSALPGARCARGGAGVPGGRVSAAPEPRRSQPAQAARPPHQPHASWRSSTGAGGGLAGRETEKKTRGTGWKGGFVSH